MKIKLVLVFMSLLTTVAAHAQARRAMTPSDLLSLVEVSDAQISPNGEWIAYVVSAPGRRESRGTLWLARTNQFVVSPEGSQQFSSQPVQFGGGVASSPRWSPDGRRLAFLGTRDNQSGIWVMSVDDRQPRMVVSVRDTNFYIPYAGESFAWSPDGRRIAYVSAVDEEADNTSGARTSRERDGGNDPRVIDRIQYKTRTSFSDRARTHVWVTEIDEPRPRLLTSGPYHDHALAWNPRGDEVAFLSNREPDPDAFNNSDIFIVNVSDGRARRLTETRGCEYEPTWSPDGRWLAFTATTRDVTTIDSVMEDAHVWVIEATGGGRREVAPTLDRRTHSPRWFPDSRTLLFLAGDRGQTLIFRAGIDGGPAQPLFIRNAPTPDERERGSGPPALPLRPYQINDFSAASRTPVFAFTLTDATHPTEVWIGHANGRRARRVSGHNDAFVRSIALVEPEEVRFRSFDGTNVQGWLLRPVGFRLSDSARHPLILGIHGGPHGMFGYNFDPTLQAYASRGYAVLYINPRGSTGYGQKFSDGTFRDWGGGDYRDLMMGLDFVIQTRSWIDESRLGVAGRSYGGYMTNWVITQTPRFRAAVSTASVSNLISFYSTSLYQDLIHAEYGGFPWDDYEILWRASPLRYAREVSTPTLFLHGENDNDVPVEQSEEMYMALKRRGVETVLVRYPREGHSNREPRHRQDALERTLAWFDKFLK